MFRRINVLTDRGLAVVFAEDTEDVLKNKNKEVNRKSVIVTCASLFPHLLSRAMGEPVPAI